VPASFPLRFLLAVHQPDVRLVHQRRGLDRLPGLLLSQLLRGQLAQPVVNERQQLCGGVRVPLLEGAQDATNVTHRTQTIA
jgi:hypothetical protein